jgi:hypothetical protein
MRSMKAIILVPSADGLNTFAVGVSQYARMFRLH